MLLSGRPDAPLPADDSAITLLRRATRSRHEHIESVVDLRRLRDAAHYGRVLQAFHAFHGPWELSVALALPPHLAAWARSRSRLAFVRHDLDALGLPPLRRPVPLVRLDSPAAALGSLYVIEGSALGGQVIARDLAREGMGPASGAAYFTGWGSRTGSMWRQFRELLEIEVGVLPGPRAQACEAACQTFDALTALLQSTLHERLAPV